MTALATAREIVMLAGDTVMTDSRKVAAAFGKRHDSVLRSFRRLHCSPDFARRNFVECLEINRLANGKPEPVIQMTKDGFMFLVMGFTGEKAARIKEAFIEAFNHMADFIRTQADGAMRRWEVAYLEYRHDLAHASHCGRDLSAWRGRKVAHLERLERLDPQIKLPLRADMAA